MRTGQIGFLLASYLLIIVLTVTGCRDPRTERDALQTVRARGVLRVGTTGDYCPMSYLNPETHTYEGFDTALADDLAASLGVGIEYIPTTWPTLMQDTLTEKFDLALCGITITPDRQRQALMSEGYLDNGKTLLCRTEDAEKYTSLAAVNRPEVRVMENPGGLNEKFARANLPEAALTIHPVNEEIPALIASGKADVMITEIMEAAYYVGKDPRLAIHAWSTRRIAASGERNTAGIFQRLHRNGTQERTPGRTGHPVPASQCSGKREKAKNRTRSGAGGLTASEHRHDMEGQPISPVPSGEAGASESLTLSGNR